MGKRFRSKAGPSQPTSLLLAEHECSERTNTGAPVPGKAAEGGFLERLILYDVEGFEAGLNELDGGYSDDSDEGGGEEGIPIPGDGDADARVDLQVLQNDELFFIDEVPSRTDLILTRDIPGISCDSSEGEEDREEEYLPAGQDSNDRMLTDSETEDLISGKEYSVRLHTQFETIYPVLEWAAGGSDRKRVTLYGARGAESSSDQEVGRMEEEGGDRERWMISTLYFHPQQHLLLSSGTDSTLHLHHINGTTTRPATSLHLRNTPIYGLA
ncbi:hypothetical protein HOY80DRAFT_1073505 [Tuber brumale]|nr:hypothetical protein HOY80DRAFT_1073505 [Tuber brumale]